MAPIAPLGNLVRTRRWLIGAAGVGALTWTGVFAQGGGLKGNQTTPETSDSERYISPVFGIEVEFTAPWQEKERTADDNAELHSVESIILRTMVPKER